MRQKRRKKQSTNSQYNSSRAWSHQFSRPWATLDTIIISPTHLLFGLSRPWRPQASTRRRGGEAEEAQEMATETTRRGGRRRRLHPAGSSTRDSSPPSFPRTGSTSLRCHSCTGFLRTLGVDPMLFLDPHTGMLVLDVNFVEYVRISRKAN